MLAKWIAESLDNEHRNGVTHGSGLSSTGSVWCAECWRRFLARQLADDNERGSE